MIERWVLGIRIGEQWYERSRLLGVSGFQLITCDQLYDPNDVPLNQPYHYEDGLPVIEIGREDITDLSSIIGEDHPLRRGFPKSGWIGFFLTGLPNWPTKVETVGGGQMEFDGETGEEVWVVDTIIVRTTDTVTEISLEVIDGHGEHHSATKSRPFGTWTRRIDVRKLV